jgi:hypothetical protein
MSLFPKVYYSCAVFHCTNCAYDTEIYSLNEHIPTTKINCSGCGKRKPGTASFWIYKNDIDENIPLHLQAADLDKSRCNYCNDCLKQQKFHWTEAVVHCEKCEQESMVFSHYVKGAKIEAFKQYAIMCSRTAYIGMNYIKEGTAYYEMSNKFSES